MYYRFNRISKSKYTSLVNLVTSAGTEFLPLHYLCDGAKELGRQYGKAYNSKLSCDYELEKLSQDQGFLWGFYMKLLQQKRSVENKSIQLVSHYLEPVKNPEKHSVFFYEIGSRKKAAFHEYKNKPGSGLVDFNYLQPIGRKYNRFFSEFDWVEIRAKLEDENYVLFFEDNLNIDWEEYRLRENYYYA